MESASANHDSVQSVCSGSPTALLNVEGHREKQPLGMESGSDWKVYIFAVGGGSHSGKSCR